MNEFLVKLAAFKEKNVLHTGWKVIKFDRYVKKNVDVTDDIRAMETEILKNSNEDNETKLGKYWAILNWMEAI